MKKNWTVEETELLITHYPDMQTQTLGKILNRSISQITSKASHLGLAKKNAYRSDRSGKLMKSKIFHWTEKDVSILKALYPNRLSQEIADILGIEVHKVHSKANKLGIKKSAEFFCGASSGRIKPVRDDAFLPEGRRARNYLPIGSETISSGFRVRKVSHLGSQRQRWRAVHHLVWEEVNGAIPKGYRLLFKDGNRMNIALDNLELVRKEDILARNTVNRYGPQIQELNRLRGLLSQQINKRSKNA